MSPISRKTNFTAGLPSITSSHRCAGRDSSGRWRTSGSDVGNLLPHRSSHSCYLAGELGNPTAGGRAVSLPRSSTNSWWVALLTFGEGWHNNHHAHPVSARHGLRWYEVDMNWYGIWALKYGTCAHVYEVKLSHCRNEPQEPRTFRSWGSKLRSSPGGIRLRASPAFLRLPRLSPPRSCSWNPSTMPFAMLRPASAPSGWPAAARTWKAATRPALRNLYLVATLSPLALSPLQQPARRG